MADETLLEKRKRQIIEAIREICYRSNIAPLMFYTNPTETPLFLTKQLLRDAALKRVDEHALEKKTLDVARDLLHEALNDLLAPYRLSPLQNEQLQENLRIMHEAYKEIEEARLFSEPRNAEGGEKILPFSPKRK